MNVQHSSFAFNFFYLEYILKFFYDDLLVQEEMFKNQVNAYNAATASLVRNGQELEQLWSEVLEQSKNEAELAQINNVIGIQLAQLEHVVGFLEKQPVRMVPDQRSQMYTNMTPLHMNPTYRDFEEEYQAFMDTHKDVFTVFSMMDAHLNILTNIEQSINRIDTALLEVNRVMEPFTYFIKHS